MIYVMLFYEFFKTGLFAVGGGLATLPFLRDMAVTHPDWFTEEMLADMIAISESTPGPIGVNMATYAGYQAAGLPGALVATFGLALPAFLTILVVIKILDKFKDNRYVNATFYGLRPAVAGLIGAAGITVAKSSLLNLSAAGNLLNKIHIPSVCIFVLVFVTLKIFKKHPLWYLLASALIGILLGFLQIL
ncbi:MAG: chromate transporter [Ruminococcaceae bacterium]|nr:chromate transporter [Oscillospiraceae bacterium]